MTRLAFDDLGSGHSLVLLHGFPFNRSLWRDQIAELTRSYRVIAPDLPGHGDSEVQAGTALMEEMAAGVVDLMDQLNISSATIGGLSMGGYVALALQHRFPSRVHSLVLADTRAQGDTPEGKKDREKQAEKVLSQGMEQFVSSFIPRLLAPETVSTRSAIVDRLRKMMLSTNSEGAAAALRGMAMRQDHTARLSQIELPTLIIVGSEDAITPVGDSEMMNRQIRGSRLEIITGAGHVSNIEQPEQFTRIVLEFLNKHSK